MSTRYGRLKQLEPLGPGGEALLDYSVYDAARSGFGRVVLVIREELEEAFRTHIRDRWPQGLEVVYHHQRLDDLGGVDPVSVPGLEDLVGAREKPWGTAHALLSARSLLHEPFAILNADDFYGSSAFHLGAALLRDGPPPDPEGRPVFGLMGYTLSQTLSPIGGVNRGICRVDGEGWLETVEEVLEILQGPDGTLGTTVPGQGVVLTGVESTSTNFWIFTPDLFPFLEAGFGEFLRDASDHPVEGAPEFLIPTEVNRLLNGGEIRVKVSEAEGPFLGITHPGDRQWVMKDLARLVKAGRYPASLWEE
jgi:hypothetical protein